MQGQTNYWEAKLAAGHQPSEAKIENFIRTKYDTKRWVMDGPIPDPSTLDAEGDDDVPLTLVQEKAKIERSTSQRETAASSWPVLLSLNLEQLQETLILFGDDSTPPLRPNSADIISTKPSAMATASVHRSQQGLLILCSVLISLGVLSLRTRDDLQAQHQIQPRQWVTHEVT